MDFKIVGSLILVSVLASCASSPPDAGLLGAYKLGDGRTISVRRSVDTTLRYRILEDGTTGRLYSAGDNVFESGPGFSAREPVELSVEFITDELGVAHEIRWSRPDSSTGVRGTRIGTERSVWIETEDTKLHGRLHLPDGKPPFVGVVLVHGSGEDAGTEWLYNGDFFVANGIAVLSFDKRGTGLSGGTFTFDFHRLADDVASAVEILAVQPEVDGQRIGLSGYSQGGWVAPLAASKNDRVKFVLVSYGLVDSPANEARNEMRQLLLDSNVAEDDLAAADELIRASVDVVASGLDNHWDRFETLKARYRDAYWLQYLDGTPIDRLISYPKWFTKLVGKRQLPNGLLWDYDSRGLLENLDIPMAWFIAEQDRSAPNEETIAVLEDLIRRGKPYSLMVFPGADHGMVKFERREEGVEYTGYVADYFRKEMEALRRMSPH